MKPAPKSLRLMADYQCYPLWETNGEDNQNIDPDKLPLSAELKVALNLWADVYDRTLDQNDPSNTGFATPAEKEVFNLEGKRLRNELQKQLGEDYQVSYFSWWDSDCSR